MTSKELLRLHPQLKYERQLPHTIVSGVVQNTT